MSEMPFKVRYSKAAGMSDWIPCEDWNVGEGVLMLRYDQAGNNLDMIPLHVITGPIEVRPNDEVVAR